VPSESGAGEALGLFISKQEAKLECFGEADVLKLGGGREGFRDVAPVERSAEAVISGALRGHERMFAYRLSCPKFSNVCLACQGTPSDRIQPPPDPMNIQEVLNRRSDLSTFLVHLTRDEVEDAEGEPILIPADRKFRWIIEDRMLRAARPMEWGGIRTPTMIPPNSLSASSALARRPWSTCTRWWQTSKDAKST
jgi:hypothetical protein